MGRRQRAADREGRIRTGVKDHPAKGERPKVDVPSFFMPTVTKKPPVMTTRVWRRRMTRLMKARAGQRRNSG